MASEISSGSQSASLNTEHTLDTRTSVGTYQLLVDCSNMANGDVTELRVYVKPRSSAGSALLHQFCTLSNKQTTVVVASVPVLCSYCYFTLKQTAGTGRAYPWSVLG
jgi:hypothetical protein